MAVRAGDARPRPDHPHQRRAAAVELPAVAVGLLRARLPRRAVARLQPPRRSRSRWPSTRPAGGASVAGEAPLMARERRTTTPRTAAAGPGRAGREPPRPAPSAGASAPRAPGASAAAAAALGPLRARARRDPGDRRRAVPRARRRARVHGRPVRARRDLHARAVRDVPARPSRSPRRLHRARGAAAGRAVRRPVPGAARRRAGAADAVRADAGLAASERRRHGADAARDLLDRLRASRTRCCCAACPTAKRS